MLSEKYSLFFPRVMHERQLCRLCKWAKTNLFFTKARGVGPFFQFNLIFKFTTGWVLYVILLVLYCSVYFPVLILNPLTCPQASKSATYTIMFVTKALLRAGYNAEIAFIWKIPFVSTFQTYLNVQCLPHSWSFSYVHDLRWNYYDTCAKRYEQLDRIVMGLSKRNNKSKLEIIREGFLVERKPEVSLNDNVGLPRKNIEVNKCCHKAWDAQGFTGERSEVWREQQINVTEMAYRRSVRDGGGNQGWQSGQGLGRQVPTCHSIDVSLHPEGGKVPTVNFKQEYYTNDTKFKEDFFSCSVENGLEVLKIGDKEFS